MTAMRSFLGLVGIAYLALGVWCAVQPVATSEAVGFTLRRGAGESEFLTVYGGLECGLGLAFLWPALFRGDCQPALRLCLLLHGSLVTFRGLSFCLYREIPAMTYGLAAVEWIIFLGAWGFWWRANSEIQ